MECVKWEEEDQSRGVIRLSMRISNCILKVILFPKETMNHGLGGVRHFVISFIKE